MNIELSEEQVKKLTQDIIDRVDCDAIAAAFTGALVKSAQHEATTDAVFEGVEYPSISKEVTRIIVASMKKVKP